MISVTSTESFVARAQQSEARRVVLWIVVLATVLLIFVSRRALGGFVMTDGKVFWPIAGALSVALVIQIVLLARLRDANRRGSILPSWIWRAAGIFDLATSLAPLLVLALWSPRGAIPALSAPSLLLLPLVILLSVLRLRPLFTLATGLAASAFHVALAGRAVVVTEASFDQYPVYFGYSAILALTALAAALVAREVRRHVVEAANESAARERADQQVATVKHDLAIARDIQVGLLPSKAPVFDGFEIAGMSRSADLTGGDYYDWQLLPDGRLVVVLADVTGHGIGPALVMAVCRAYARATATLLLDPALLMRRLNELLQPDLPTGRFITLAIATLDPEGSVQLLSAGHGPTFFYSASTKEVRQFGGDGLPLGVDPDGDYDPPAILQMQEGDLLVLLTDGFFEWQRSGDGGQFGIARVEGSLVANAGEPPDQILRALDSDVLAFAAGSAQQDDVTAVVIKRTARTVGDLQDLTTSESPVAVLAR